jgi:ABC-2 type transport system permease protein
VGSIVGWEWEQILVFVCGYLLVDALQMTLFSNNFFWFPIAVNRGDLDYHLIRPVSPLFMVTLREFAVNSFLNLLCALGLMVWALIQYFQAHPQGSWMTHVFSSLGFVFLIGIGTLIHAGLQWLFLLPVFWTQSTRGFEQAFFTLHRFAERPHQIFTGPLRFVLLSVVPFALIASVPAQVLFGPHRLAGLLNIFGVFVVLMATIAWVWNKALRSYSSASS